MVRSYSDLKKETEDYHKNLTSIADEVLNIYDNGVSTYSKDNLLLILKKIGQDAEMTISRFRDDTQEKEGRKL